MSKSKKEKFKLVENTPKKFQGKQFVTNLTEQKELFYKCGKVTGFHRLNGSPVIVKNHRKIVNRHFQTALNILEKTKLKYGDGIDYLDKAYGYKIDCVEGCEKLGQYLETNNLNGNVTVYWTSQLEGSAKMIWNGPHTRLNRPENRQYTLLINSTCENIYLRENGIICLADHELGTHYYRMYNDGYQPWFSNRKMFGLRPSENRICLSTDEGLACLNTQLSAGSKFLWQPALLYYVGCMSEIMTFKQLFDHLEQYVTSRDIRWRLVMRAKRFLPDPNHIGGTGNDQIYLEGAIDILRNIDQIDFNVLYSGRISYDEVDRVKRIVRMNCLKIPSFLQDEKKYKKRLKQIARINGIINTDLTQQFQYKNIPSSAYTFNSFSIDTKSLRCSKENRKLNRDQCKNTIFSN